ncbi:MAG: alpha-hydroxy acid oxidase [Roseiflexaceae bacterium]
MEQTDIFVNIRDFEQAAHRILPNMAWDYFAGGAEDEYTMIENCSAFRKIKLRPRVLRDVTTRSLATKVLGQAISLPVMLGPTTHQRLAHPDAELATARAASAMQTIAVCATETHFRIGEIAEAASYPIWFQLYCCHSRIYTERLVRRAEAAHCRALVVTVDATYDPRRERLMRKPFILPNTISLGNFVDIGLPGNPNQDDVQYMAITWSDIEWLRTLTSLPIILKGIMTSEDAQLAVEHGVEGLVVSNHGGRQLDGTLPTVEALPEIIEAVDNKVEVYLDGGIRRGTDVIKAIALGAKAVLLGRAYLWGLAVDGQQGVESILGIFKSEIDCAMAQLGCKSISDIDRSVIDNNAHLRQMRE